MPPNPTLAQALAVDQSFPNDAVSVSASYSATSPPDQSNVFYSSAASGPVQNMTASSATLSVQYDASSASYTLNLGSGPVTFGPADLTESSSTRTTYTKAVSGGTETLDLKTPDTYVGMGFWLQNLYSGGVTSSVYSTFTYGMQTALAGIPRSGDVGYTVDWQAYVTQPGENERLVSSQATFEVDFGSGTFKLNDTSYPFEGDLITGSQVPASILNTSFLAVGRLTSSDTTFTGNAVYKDGDGSYFGAINGRFYGPEADEVGASFVGYEGAGSIVGSLAGPQSASPPTENLAMTNIVVQQAFSTTGGELYTDTSDTNASQATYDTGGTITVAPDGTVQFAPSFYWIPSSIIPKIESSSFGPADIVPSTRPNFTTYQTTSGGVPLQLELYNVGPGNSELALTYMDLAIWTEGAGTPSQPGLYQLYSVFGMPTSPDVVSHLTGSARYTGVVYGSAIDPAANRYDVTGSSSFLVNFDSQSLTSTLTMNGVEVGSGATVNFGSYSLSGNLVGNSVNLSVDPTGGSGGNATVQFYGPLAEEIGGNFILTRGGNYIAGAVAAKR